MEINETEKIIVKTYKTDFGSVCNSEEECIEKEYKGYLSIYNSLSISGKKISQKVNRRTGLPLWKCLL